MTQPFVYTLQLTMLEIIIFAIAIVVVALVMRINMKMSTDAGVQCGTIRLPYEKSKTLLSLSNLKFFRALEAVVAEQYVVFAQVRVIDFIDVKKGMSKNDHARFEQQISSMHVSFLLCKPENTQTVAAICFDDATHDATALVEQDKLAERIFKDAGLPFLRFKVKANYSNEIVDQLHQSIGFKVLMDEEEGVS